MSDRYYTLGMWRPKPDREADFTAAWKELGEVFLGLPSPPGPGILLRSESDPGLFYSFGPWSGLEDIEAMRADPQALDAIRRLIDLCEEASPGTYRVVAEVPDPT